MPQNFSNGSSTWIRTLVIKLEGEFTVLTNEEKKSCSIIGFIAPGCTIFVSLMIFVISCTEHMAQKSDIRKTLRCTWI